AAARRPDDQVDRVRRKTAMKDCIEPWLAAGKAVAHVTFALGTDRARALAPARRASSELSRAETARIRIPALAMNSRHSRKPAPPEIRRSSTTRSGERS